MNIKFVYTTMTALAFSACTTFATEVAATQTDNESIIQRLEALEALEDNANKSSWAENIKIKGDFRYRFEDRDSDQSAAIWTNAPNGKISDKSRHRIRARVGAYGNVNEHVDFGVRIATGSSSSPISTNQDIDGYGSSKEIWLDLAYITLNCYRVDGLNVTFGKMKQPWITVSDLVYDSDFNPEGISAGYDIDLDGISVMLHAGHFILDENAGDDVQLSSGQAAIKTKVSEGVSLTAGANIYDWRNEDAAAVGDGNSGAIDFTIVEGFAQVNLTETPVPVKIFGDFANNMANDISEDTAWMIGFGTKIGKLSLDYNYRDVEADSIYGDWADSDFHDGGTGGSGHKIKAQYAVMKNLSAGATYFMTETQSGNDVNTLQFDLAAKF